MSSVGKLLIELDFVMCNQVVVSTKSPRSDKQYVWEAAADSSSYVIKEETDPEKLLKRGTEITLYLRVLSDLVFINRKQDILSDVCGQDYMFECISLGHA